VEGGWTRAGKSAISESIPVNVFGVVVLHLHMLFLLCCVVSSLPNNFCSAFGRLLTCTGSFWSFPLSSLFVCRHDIGHMAVLLFSSSYTHIEDVVRTHRGLGVTKWRTPHIIINNNFLVAVAYANMLYFNL
jgi:hypothetical protein